MRDAYDNATATGSEYVRIGIAGGAAVAIAGYATGALGGEAIGAFAAATRGAASGLGDLTVAEAAAIQKVVNQAGRPIDVVGSAARGARHAGSDIDYVTHPQHLPHFKGLEGNLPKIDPEHGIVPGAANPYIGPSIRFEPN
jgi:hypothetical protein